MRPKGKLLALLAVFAAIGIVTASGAFTTVSAERTATAEVAGDSAALLQLEPTAGATGNNSSAGTSGTGYAEINSGQLEIDLTGGQGASGLNLNAETQIDGVFTITNQGTQDVGVYITDSGNNNGTVTFQHDGSSIEDTSNAVTLSPGESITIDINVDTVGEGLNPSDELIDGFTVNAEESEA